jgi:hypothetical protein
LANRIEYIGLEAGNHVGATSRYYDSPLIRYGDQGKLAFPIYRKKEIGFASTDQYFEIPKSMAYRPDKVSFSFYGAPDFWWKIMEMNGMKDVLEFVAGRTIRLPSALL